MVAGASSRSIFPRFITRHEHAGAVKVRFEPLFDDPASFIEGLLLPIHSTDLGNV